MKIKAAAIMDRNTGKFYTLPKPNRHSDVIKWMAQEHGIRPQFDKHEQGFITDTNVFVPRHTAAQIAQQSGQCLEPLTPNKLCTEDLW